MIEARRRPAPASASTSHSHEKLQRHQEASMRSISSGSVTPLEEDEDAPKRSSRGRNPLPRTVGPLFPPLPHKPPKESPTQLSTKSTRTPSITMTAVFPSQSPLAQSLGEPGPWSVTQFDLGSTSRPTTPLVENPDLPSTSNNSLSPPPPTSDDVVLGMDMDLPGEEVEEGPPAQVAEPSDDWEAYRRHRDVRGFDAVQADVKLEPGEETEEAPVPSRNPRKSHKRKLSFPTSPGATSPSRLTPASIGSSSRHRRRRGEDQLLLDDHLLPKEMRKTGSLSGKRKGMAEKDEEEGEEGVSGQAGGDASGQSVEDPPEVEQESQDVTRCVCKRDDGDELMIQCDMCNVWQHGPCVGIWADEEAPDEYFCEECKPEYHGPLKKWLRSRGRNPPTFIPPTPNDLLRFHPATDRNPPSQSKRWTDPALIDPPPQKPSSRSHHRKDVKDPVSPVESLNDGRRSTRGRLPPAPLPPTREKSASIGKHESSFREPKRLASDHRRKVSMGDIAPSSPTKATSLSPSAPPPPPKRRSTMNSRDAAYEEAVQAALEASKREAMLADGVEGSDVGEEGDGQVLDDEEALEPEPEQRKGKRKREDGDSESLEPSTTPGPGGSKAKHPNQYTYRLKPPSSSNHMPPAAPSPARRGVQGGTPVPPSLPPPAQHEHGTRRAGAIANGSIPAPPTTYSVKNLHWHLPDHLSPHADLLPTASPVAVEVRSPRVLSSIPKNHFHNQKYGPFLQVRDDQGKLLLPGDPPFREALGESTTHLEPPARVRYPAKRITTAEIRKRVRNVLEYVGRVQVEEGKRKERAKLFGIEVNSLPPPAKYNDEEDVIMGETNSYDGEVGPGALEPIAEQPSSMSLLADLMGDLIGFQDTFAQGGFGFASPFPPLIATFPTQPPITPTLPSSARMNPADSLTGAEHSVEQVGEDETVDVYREGAVDTVMTQEIEQQAADTVEAGASAA